VKKFKVKVTFDNYDIIGKQLPDNALHQTVKIRAMNNSDAINKVQDMSFGNKTIAFIKVK
jgi:hypothetical protein